eukprot:jgi/Hompol1/5793/HPOL_004711-RA
MIAPAAEALFVETQPGHPSQSQFEPLPLRPQYRLRGHTRGINLILSNFEGNIVSFDDSAVIIVWDLQTLTAMTTINAATILDTVLSMNVHGRRVIAGGLNGNIAIWDIDSGALEAVFCVPERYLDMLAHGSLVNVAIHGDTIVYGLSDGCFFVYHIGSKELVARFCSKDAPSMASAATGSLDPIQDLVPDQAATSETEIEDDFAYQIEMDEPGTAEGNTHFSASAWWLSSMSLGFDPPSPPYIPGTPLTDLEAELQHVAAPTNSQSAQASAQTLSSANAFDLSNSGPGFGLDSMGSMTATSSIAHAASIHNQQSDDSLNLNDLITDNADDADVIAQTPATHQEGTILADNMPEIDPGVGMGAEQNAPPNAPINPPINDPFAPSILALNGHVILTNGAKSDEIALWDSRTGAWIQTLSEIDSLAQHGFSVSSFRGIKFAEMAHNGSCVFASVSFEGSHSMIVWDFQARRLCQRSFQRIALEFPDTAENSMEVWLCTDQLQ